MRFLHGPKGEHPESANNNPDILAESPTKITPASACSDGVVVNQKIKEESKAKEQHC